MTEWHVIEESSGKFHYDTSADPNKADLYRYPTDMDLAHTERTRRARGDEHFYNGDIEEVRAVLAKAISGSGDSW
jgi:hypothetical protein